ncbi:MAG: hypothetical protein RLN83_01260 [Balneola sp.]
MIKYDYKILRDEGDESKVYMPGEIPKEVDNVTYIEAPNSRGKSTLLNILAISFYGHRLSHDDLAQSLRNKINSLLYSEHQKLSFDVTISNSSNYPLFKASKKEDSNDVEVKEFRNGEFKPISFDQFKRKYRLIYDIPEKPTERINQILSDISADLKRKADRLKGFNSVVKANLGKADNAKDPKKIDKLNKINQENEKKIEKSSKQLSQNVELLNQSKILNHGLEYIHLTAKLRKKEKEVQSLKGKKTQTNKIEKRISNELGTLLQQRKDLIDNIRSQLEEAYNELEEISLITKNELDKWKKYDLIEEIKDYKNLSYFRDQLNEYIEAIDKELLSIESNDSLKEANFFQELKDFLKKFKSSNIALPETQKSIRDYIQTLDKKIADSRELVQKRDDIVYTYELLEGIDYNISEAIKTHQRIIKKEDYTDKLDKDIESKDVEDQIQFEKNLLKQIEDQLEYRNKKLINLQVDPSNIKAIVKDLSNNKEVNAIGSLSDAKFTLKVNEIEDSIDIIQQEIDTLNEEIKFNEIEIEDLDQKEEHSYSDYKEELNELYENLFELIGKIENEYIEYLSIMIDGRSNDDDSFKSFSKIISKYIANKMKTIRHIDKTYDLLEVDLINKKVITKSGKIILLEDLGTGQGQSAYIDSLLSLNDGRKTLALFDEVGMMDGESLSPINQKLKKLHDDGKLLVGVVVQRGKKTKVKSLL